MRKAGGSGDRGATVGNGADVIGAKAAIRLNTNDPAVVARVSNGIELRQLAGPAAYRLTHFAKKLFDRKFGRLHRLQRSQKRARED